MTSVHHYQAKHLLDAVFIALGGTTTAVTLADVFKNYINPVLAGGVSFLTIVWLVYRIIEMHENRQKVKQPEEK